jgi:hypothetical protein
VRELLLVLLGALAGMLVMRLRMTALLRELRDLRRTTKLMKRAQRPWRRCPGCSGHDCEYECAYPNSLPAGRAHT